jgi:arylsulfatase A-like enzyme
MDRRSFLQTAGAVALAGTLPAAVRRRAQEQQPNVILIVADDLGYGDLSLTGRSDYATPVIDQIARAGAFLTQAYASAPVCTPTRVALMTGRYPARYVAGLYEPLTIQRLGLAPTPATLPRLLKRAGYETALVGKWHLGLLPQFHPLRHGFDEFYGFLGPAADYASHYDSETRNVSYFRDGDRPVNVKGYLTDLFTDRAVRIVTRKRRKPFFLSLQYNAPHWPWQAPGDPPYADSMRTSSGGSPETFARMVQSMDVGVGRILDALHKRGLEHDTLVIFTSDNGGERFSRMGPSAKAKCRCTKAARASSPWRAGRKSSLPGPAASRCVQHSIGRQRSQRWQTRTQTAPRPSMALTSRRH